MKNLLLICIFPLLISCGTTAEFTISKVVPAAEIVAKKKKDSNDNFSITVTAIHLANPERLNPSRNYYNVWGITKDKEIKNLGRLTIKKGSKGFLNTNTPFDFNEILITAEKKGDLLQPDGIEISRAKF